MSTDERSNKRRKTDGNGTKPLSKEDVYDFTMWLREMDSNKNMQQKIKRVSSLFLYLGLPREIVNQILDLAEYWYVQCSGREVLLDMGTHRWGTPNFEASCLYLRSRLLESGLGAPQGPVYRPRKVVFEIVSHDNCVSFDPRAGSYPNEYSWFDASIFREDTSWPQSEQAQPGAGSVDPPRYHVSYDPEVRLEYVYREAPEIGGGFKVVENNGKSMWMLQTNRCGGNMTYERRRVIWTDNKDLYDYPRKWGHLGSGYGNKFVQSLRKGDTIGVWARAMYPHGKNMVQSVKVDVYYSTF